MDVFLLMNFNDFKFLKSLSLKKLPKKELDLDFIINEFDQILETNLKRIKDKKSALFFSGGIDSSILAYKLKELEIKFAAVIIADGKEPDFKNAIEIAEELDINIINNQLTIDKFEPVIPEIMRIINDTEEKEVNIAAPFLLGAKFLQRNGFNIAILGQGADELFGGYQRYVDFAKEKPDQFKDFHLKDIKESVLKNYARDNSIFTNFNIHLYLPYFAEKSIELALALPTNLIVKIDIEPPIKKVFLREYAKKIGLSKNIYQKKKIAIQFGSGSYKLLRKIALKNGFTKELAEKYGYRRNVQLYLDFVAQMNLIKDSKLDTKLILSELIHNL